VFLQHRAKFLEPPLVEPHVAGFPDVRQEILPALRFEHELRELGAPDTLGAPDAMMMAPPGLEDGHGFGHPLHCLVKREVERESRR